MPSAVRIAHGVLVAATTALALVMAAWLAIGVVSGIAMGRRGKLGLPDGTEVAYQAPELYVFHPDALHDWHDVEQTTLLSVCLVRSG